MNNYTFNAVAAHIETGTLDLILVCDDRGKFYTFARTIAVICRLRNIQFFMTRNSITFPTRSLRVIYCDGDYFPRRFRGNLLAAWILLPEFETHIYMDLGCAVSIVSNPIASSYHAYLYVVDSSFINDHLADRSRFVKGRTARSCTIRSCGSYIYIPCRELLIGIEHNPGPDDMAILSFVLFCNVWLAYYQIYCFACALSGRFSAHQVLERSYFTHCFGALGFFCVITFAEGLFSHYNAVDHVPAPPLVGVEPNPGPNDLVTYLRNMEKLEAPRATTRQRRACKSKQTLSHERSLKAKRENRISSLRDAKTQRFYIEGIVDVSLDSETMAFMDQIVDRVVYALGNINVRISSSLTDKVSDILSYLKDLGGDVWNFAIGIVRIVFSFFSDTARHFLEFFLPPAMEVESPSTWHLALSAIYSKHLWNIVSVRDWDTLVRSLGEIRRKSTTYSSAVETLRGILDIVATFVCDLFGLTNPFETDEDREIKRIRAAALELDREYRSGCESEYFFAEKVYALHEEMENMLASKKTLSPRGKDTLTYLLRKFSPIVNYCMRTINPNNGPRTEPTAIIIGGPSGTGKSSITVPFLLALLANTLPEDKLEDFKKNHNDFIFFRANENEYWDGYKVRNVAVVYDDFGQRTDVKGSPNPDAMELIRLVNTAAYHLHMAALEDKQRVYARPSLIFATSNLKQLWFESIVCPQAVIRRFDMAYYQVPKAKYCVDPWVPIGDRQLDINKLRADHPECDDDVSSFFILDAVEYVPWDFYSGREVPGGQVLTFNDLLKLAIQVVKQKKDKGDKMLNFHKYMMNFKPEGDISDDEYYDALEEIEVSLNERLSNWVRDVANFQHFSRYGRVAAKYMTAPMLRVARALVSVAGATVSLYYAYSKVSSFLSSLVHIPESAYSRKEVSKSGARRIVRSRVNKANRKALQLDVESGVGSIDPYLRLLKRNMYRMFYRDKYIGWSLFLRGSVFVCPKHFDVYFMHSEDVDEGDAIMVDFKHYESGRTAFAVDWSDLGYYDKYDGDLEPYDYAFFKLPFGTARLHADITGYFAADGKLKKGEYYESQLALVRGEQLVMTSTSVEVTGDIVYDGLGRKFKSRSMFYSAPTMKGDCGAPLVSMDPRFGRPTILGIHTAGTVAGLFRAKNCAGVALCKGEIEQVLDAFEERYFDEEIPVMEVEGLVGFNTLANLKQPRLATVTSLRRSDLSRHLTWKPQMEPARLCPFVNADGVELNPMRIARSNYSHDERGFSNSVRDSVYYYLSNHALKSCNADPWKPRLLTFEEAVKGVDGVDYVDGVNRSTSPGYPYVLTNTSKGKYAWFGSDGDYDLSSAQARALRSEVEQIIDRARRGVRSLHVYMDCLKDERRPCAKVQAGKTRQIMSCPLALLVLTKMYFGDFVRYICSNRIVNGVAVGIDPRTEWDTLAQHLGPGDGWLYTAGDYSKFDGKIPAQLGWIVYRVILDFYRGCPGEDNRVREVLFHEIVNSMHISEGRLYECVGGNPSGNGLTAVYNSLVNMAIMYTVLVRTCHEDNSDLPDLNTVANNFRIITYGDDVVIAYRGDFGRYFSQSVLSHRIPLWIGMDFTAEDKSDSVVDGRLIHQVTFLKRAFVYRDACWLCPLELSVVLETLHWQKKNTDIGDMRERVEGVLSELAMHGEDTFRKYGPVVVRASLESIGYTPRCSTYSAALRSGVYLMA